MTVPSLADDARGPIKPLSTRDRYVILIAAFLGWMFAGVEMGMYLAARPAAIHFLSQTSSAAPSTESSQGDASEKSAAASKEIRSAAGDWAARYMAAFLLGGAVGGLLFGWLGDNIGRSKAMGLSIVWYSVWTGASFFVPDLWSLITLRFIACLGVGGMWPTGVALASEAWSNASRPLLAGLIGGSANVGLAAMGLVADYRAITPDDWRWVMLVGAAPVVLGIVVLLFVPESPSWLHSRGLATLNRTVVPTSVVFRKPYLKVTIIGILLGAVPLLGGWGALNWLILWAQQYEDIHHVTGISGMTQFMRSAGATVGSLFGGWLASQFGRRSTYFVVSLSSLLISGYIFWNLTPGDPTYNTWAFVIGTVATIAFGWLPLYLPELYPTHIRATGSGVTYNFGRFLAAAGVLGAGALTRAFDGNYAHVGRVTHLVFAIGMIVILFAPDTSQRRMDE